MKGTVGPFMCQSNRRASTLLAVEIQEYDEKLLLIIESSLAAR
jgi:hypothetical protein